MNDPSVEHALSVLERKVEGDPEAIRSLHALRSSISSTRYRTRYIHHSAREVLVALTELLPASGEGFVQASDISERTGVERTSVSYALKTLALAGFIQKESRGRGGTWVLLMREEIDAFLSR